MSTTNSSLQPSHVPSSYVIDFDVYDPIVGKEDFHSAWNRLHEENVPDVVWTPRYGGHWIATRANTIDSVLSDYHNFSSRIVAVPKEIGEMSGILPTVLDPPIHGPVRNVLNSSLSPKAVRANEDAIRAIAANLVDDLLPKGECDFTRDYAGILPIQIFLDMANLPRSDADMLIALVHKVLRPGGSNEEGLREMKNYMMPICKARNGQDNNDILSRLSNGRIDGSQIDFETAHMLCTNILLGGLDTVVNFLSFAFYFLATNPSHRAELVADADLIPDAIMELGRRFGVVVTAREVRRDMTFAGAELKAGEVIIAPTLLSGIDDRENENPLDVNFHRTSMRHSLFGNGSHKCPGALLARTEIRISLEEWLKRIPDFSLRPGAKFGFTGGVVGGMTSLPLVWNAA